MLESPFRILVVDDDEISREILLAALEPLGHQATAASDGNEAWKRLRSQEFDLVVTDWVMPGVSGLELCRRVRSLEDRYIYLILVTGRQACGDIAEGIEAGADDFIQKPVSPVELAARVRAIHRLKMLNDRVIRQNRDLRLAQQLKNDWINMIVHDLRSPLAVVQGYCDLLIEGFAKDPKARIEKIRDESSRIQDMLEQMLVMAKSEEGRLTLDLGRHDLSALLESSCESARAVAGAKGIRVELDAPAEPLEAECDRSLLRRMIDNLVSNAIKFSPAESVVRVHLHREGSEVLLEVIDEGPGVPEHLADRIFEKFETGPASAPGASQHGLGLAFCRLVAEAHGGWIGCLPSPSGGSRFEVRLPEHARVRAPLPT